MQHRCLSSLPINFTSTFYLFFLQSQISVMWCTEDVCRGTQSKHPAHCETLETCKCFFPQMHTLLFITAQYMFADRGPHNLGFISSQYICVYEAVQVSLWYYITGIISGMVIPKPAQLVWLCLPEGQMIRLNYLTTLCLNQQVCGTIERSNLRTLWMCHSAIWIQTAEWSSIWPPPLQNQTNMAAGLERIKIIMMI